MPSCKDHPNTRASSLQDSKSAQAASPDPLVLIHLSCCQGKDLGLRQPGTPCSASPGCKHPHAAGTHTSCTPAPRGLESPSSGVFFMGKAGKRGRLITRIYAILLTLLCNIQQDSITSMLFQIAVFSCKQTGILIVSSFWIKNNHFCVLSGHLFVLVFNYRVH